MSETHPDLQLLNLGETVTTKKFGTVTVKEITFEDVQRFAQELVILVAGMDLKSLTSTDGIGTLSAVIASPQTLQALYTVMAVACGKEPSEFNRLPVNDGLKIFQAFIKVNDLKELKELFFQVFPNLVSRLGQEVRKLSSPDKGNSSSLQTS